MLVVTTLKGSILKIKKGEEVACLALFQVDFALASYPGILLSHAVIHETLFAHAACTKFLGKKL